MRNALIVAVALTCFGAEKPRLSPAIQEIVRGVSEIRIEATLKKLEGFGTRYILSAQDDPFVPISMFYPHRAASKLLSLAHPREGGHCGYWRARRPRFWAAEAALRFFERDEPET